MPTPERKEPGNAMQAGRARAIALTCVAVVAGMVGLSYAAVPLYQLFCQVTGYGGTTNTADIAPDRILDREITIRFDASTSNELPWEFEPEQTAMKLKVGETGLAFYRATNNSDEPIVGTATYNVTPQKAGYYFSKIDCFCFTKQILMPGETVDMPVTFFVDPEIAEEPNLDDITTITLSYTFFRSKDESDEIAVLGGDAGGGDGKQDTLN